MIEKVVRAMRQRLYPDRILAPLDEAGRLYWRALALAAIRALPLPDPDVFAAREAAAAEAMREACAEIVAFWPTGITTAAQEQIAAAIRARKDTPA